MHRSLVFAYINDTHKKFWKQSHLISSKMFTTNLMKEANDVYMETINIFKIMKK